MKRFIAIFYSVLALVLLTAVPRVRAAFGNVYYCFMYYGQSLSQGAYGYPILTPFDPLPSTAVMLYSTYAGSSPNQNSTSSEASTTYTKLVPAYNSWFSSIANSSAGEFPGIATAEAWDSLNGTLNTPTAQPLQLVLGVGVGGYTIAQLSSGQTPYTNWENAITGALALLPSGATMNIPAIPFVQGEADMADGTSGSTYSTAVTTLQSNMASEIETLTGQSNTPLMFNTQETNWYGAGTSNTSYYQAITDAQLAVAYPNSNLIFNIGPLYWAENNNVQSGHITARSYFYLGEYFAKAMQRILPTAVGGLNTPYAPAPYYAGSASNSGATVTIALGGGVGGYQLDCTYVSSPNGACDGFYYTDNGSAPACQSVAVSGSNLVMTLASAPGSGHTATVEYAEPFTGGGTTVPGNQSGLRGCLHDSDSYTSLLDGHPLYNYLAAFHASFTTN